MTLWRSHAGKAAISFSIRCATCSGLFGLLLRVDGFTLANVCGFYLGGFLLLLLYSPRAPRAEFR